MPLKSKLANPSGVASLITVTVASLTFVNVQTMLAPATTVNVTPFAGVVSVTPVQSRLVSDQPASALSVIVFSPSCAAVIVNTCVFAIVPSSTKSKSAAIPAPVPSKSKL